MDRAEFERRQSEHRRNQNVADQLGCGQLASVHWSRQNIPTIIRSWQEQLDEAPKCMPVFHPLPRASTWATSSDTRHEETAEPTRRQRLPAPAAQPPNYPTPLPMRPRLPTPTLCKNLLRTNHERLHALRSIQRPPQAHTRLHGIETVVNSMPPNAITYGTGDFSNSHHDHRDSSNLPELPAVRHMSRIHSQVPCRAALIPVAEAPGHPQNSLPYPYHLVPPNASANSSNSASDYTTAPTSPTYTPDSPSVPRPTTTIHHSAAQACTFPPYMIESSSTDDPRLPERLQAMHFNEKPRISLLNHPVNVPTTMFRQETFCNSVEREERSLWCMDNRRGRGPVKHDESRMNWNDALE